MSSDPPEVTQPYNPGFLPEPSPTTALGRLSLFKANNPYAFSKVGVGVWECLLCAKAPTSLIFTRMRTQEEGVARAHWELSQRAADM